MRVATKVGFPHSAEQLCVKAKGLFRCERLQREAKNPDPSRWRSAFPAAAARWQILADETGVNSGYSVHA